jgi:uncharacterized BrkB/YihY/UPF0761 family membrane protein
VVKQFRANQGVLLAGAVAYYKLLSLNVVVMFTQRLTSAKRYLWRSLAEGAQDSSLARAAQNDRGHSGGSR